MNEAASLSNHPGRQCDHLTNWALLHAPRAQASPLGSLAMLLSARLRPKFGSGPPKQFAVGVGILFSGIGMMCYCEWLPGEVGCRLQWCDVMVCP